jgi:hypothetical protein
VLRRGQVQTKGQAKDHNKEPKPTKAAKLNERKGKTEKPKQPNPNTKNNPATADRSYKARRKNAAAAETPRGEGKQHSRGISS